MDQDSFSGTCVGSDSFIYHVIITSQGSATNTDFFRIDAFTEPFHQWIPYDQYNDAYLDTTADTGGGFELSTVNRFSPWSTERPSFLPITVIPMSRS